MRRPMELRDIPVDKVDGLVTGPYGSRNPEIASDSNAPRRIHNFRGASEEITRRYASGCKRLLQRLGLKRRGRHALPVNRIEAADRVAENQVAFGKTGQRFVKASDAGRKGRLQHCWSARRRRAR